MANTQYLGTNAGFYYTELGATTWKTYLLAVPLREGKIGFAIRQFVSESLDVQYRQVLNVVSTGGFAGILEYAGAIRYEDDPEDLRQFLYHGILQSGSTTYPIRYTNTVTTGTTSGGMGPGADVYLIEPTGDVVTALLDRQRASFGDQEITIRVRAINQSQDFTTASGARWF